ncbi:hypothetical protein AB7M69_001440 [Bradyrhizobium japonicum]
MDARETSAMTEASGLPNEPNGFENPLPGTSGMRKQTDLREAAEELAERLRKMTMEAPLRSLLVAFVLGVWFARRR